MEKEIPWVYWSWCRAHHVELAVKDALKGSSFDVVDEMLLRLYYIYEKSPKKCRHLDFMSIYSSMIEESSQFEPVDRAGYHTSYF